MDYILDFKNHASQEQINQFLTDNNFTVIKTYNHFENIFLVSGDNPPPASDILEKVTQDSNNPISLLDTNVDIVTLASEVTDINLNNEQNWWKIALLEKVDFDQETNQVKKYGSRATVYLLDSGVNTNHAEFANNKVVNLFSFNNDFTDTKGHGTALASVISGVTCGLTIATVKSVKIFDVNTATKQSDLLSAFDTVAVDFLQNGEKFSIVNLSWVIPKNEYIEDKINYLISLGLTVICSAGNSGQTIQTVTPASMSNVIKVGSFNQNFEPCNFSNYVGGSEISVTAGTTNYTDTGGQLFGWAPGEMIYAATKNGGFGYVAGTSVSAAIASAVLAHNGDLKLTNDGSVGSVIKTTTFFNTPNKVYLIPGLTFKSIFIRKNVLQLPGTYASSPNNIATLRVNSLKPNIDESLNEIRHIVGYNLPFKTTIFDREKFNKVTYPDLSAISPLLKIDNGFLYGSVENLNDLPAEKFTIPITVSQDDQNAQTFTVTLVVIKSIEDLKNSNVSISSVDPNMQISLQLSACCIWTGSACTDDGDACDIACAQTFANTCGGTVNPSSTGCQGPNKAGCCCVCVSSVITDPPCPGEPESCPCGL